MTRSKDPAHKSDLLGRATVYVLEHGFSGLSLRPLAEGIGSSARMLIHHFGSKETLLGLIVEHIEAQYLALSDQMLEQEGSPVRMLEKLWETLTLPANEQFQRSTFELWGYALMNPVGLERLTENLVTAWTTRFSVGFVRAGLKRKRADVLAALTVATVEGLLLQRLTVSQNSHSQAAFKQFVRWLEFTLVEEVQR
jgi:AcrR family transcriptional regulator